MTRHWYRRSLTWLTIVLLPFSFIFRFIVGVRFFLYRMKLKKSMHFSVPVIAVGNLTVGGTGKTPLVIWLAHFLRAQGFSPGIVSRGVGGQAQKKPVSAGANSDPAIVGDEALLLAKHSGCSVVVCVDRVAAIKKLIGQCTVIISDDGLQHYRMGRAIEIIMLDGDRGLGNYCLLPAGPLRERPERLNTVDFVVQQGGVPNANYFQMHLQGNGLVSIRDRQKTLSLENLRGQKVNAVAGIGNPHRFFTFLKQAGLQIVEHIFSDHYVYQSKDFDGFDQSPIVMTEKDAVKCTKFADDRFWYLPVETQVDSRFGIELLNKLRIFI
ncbi:MAG: lpxK [Gammaproteobacteria bacterium]|jgi:tetraacyldisaccharide 4'-kinase|nr:lpxK [Gammaproteobacteria bacterium]MCE3237695.1 lpxK [Gammaproteobacteria bacterium]